MIRRTATTIVIAGMLSCTPYHEYAPVVRIDGQLFDKPELMNDPLRANVVLVLTYYNEDWKMDGDRLLVSQDDRELLWNYTMKALDRDWLATHLPAQNK